jgi:NADH dehydrogenase FAD-containing subunit
MLRLFEHRSGSTAPGLPDAPALEKVPGVFVVGDAASVVCNGRPVPGVARAAIQDRRYVGRLIARLLKGREQNIDSDTSIHGGRPTWSKKLTQLFE